MGNLKKEIEKANNPKRVEKLLGICLLRFAEFLNTSSIHAAMDYSGYFINGKFYSNKEMVQEFIDKFGNERSAAEKAEDSNWLNLDKPKGKVIPKPKLGLTKITGGKTGKRGRPKKI